MFLLPCELLFEMRLQNSQPVKTKCLINEFLKFSLIIFYLEIIAGNGHALVAYGP